MSAASMDAVVELVREAGTEILRRYGAGDVVEEKADRTPLTAADRAAHEHLLAGLLRLTPSIPVVSEESAASEIEGRAAWGRHWLVDPLDGTKEFVKGTGEFTVNVALIEEGRPVVGIVHAPVLGSTWRGSREWGAQKAERGGVFQSVRTRSFPQDAPVLVGSRDHSGPAVERMARELGPAVRFTSMGSSLKFCLVAEGRADLYLRDRPTMEWDTAAAQCVVEQAGGTVVALDGDSVETPLRYGKSTLRNPQFLCVGDPNGPWRSLIRRVVDVA